MSYIQFYTYNFNAKSNFWKSLWSTAIQKMNENMSSD